MFEKTKEELMTVFKNNIDTAFKMLDDAVQFALVNELDEKQCEDYAEEKLNEIAQKYESIL